MPKCNSEAMSMHLEEIAFHIAPGAHAVVVLDQAGWHGSADSEVIAPTIPRNSRPGFRSDPAHHSD